MKNFSRKRKVIKEEPKVCKDGSIQWGKLNIKFDVNPDVSWSGVDWGKGSYGCSISWMIAPPTGGPGRGPLWPGQKKLDDIESVFNYIVNELNVDENQALKVVNDLAPIVRNMGRRGPKNPMPKPTPTYDYPKGLEEGTTPRPLKEERSCGGGGGGGDDKYTFSWKFHPDGSGSIGGMKGLTFTCKLTIRFKVAPPGGGGPKGGKDELMRAMSDTGISAGQIRRILSSLEKQADRNGSSSVKLKEPTNVGTDMKRGGGCPGYCEPPQEMDANCNCVDEFSMMDPTRNPFPGPVGPSGPLPSDLYI